MIWTDIHSPDVIKIQKELDLSEEVNLKQQDEIL